MSFVTQAVQAYYRKAREPKYDPAELRLSDTGDCQRKRVMKALGYEQTHQISQEALQKMEAGTVWEAWLIERIKESGVKFAGQIEVQTPYGAGGHIDLKTVTDDGTVYHEAKATNSYAAKYLPERRHVAQLMAYLHFEGQREDVTQGEIDYVFYDTGAVPDPFPVHYDPAQGAEIEAELRELRALIDAGTAPEIPDWMQAGQFPCSWTSRSGGGHCQYFGHCWGKG